MLLLMYQYIICKLNIEGMNQSKETDKDNIYTSISNPKKKRGKNFIKNEAPLPLSSFHPLLDKSCTRLHKSSRKSWRKKIQENGLSRRAVPMVTQGETRKINCCKKWHFIAICHVNKNLTNISHIVFKKKTEKLGNTIHTGCSFVLANNHLIFYKHANQNSEELKLH